MKLKKSKSKEYLLRNKRSTFSLSWLPFVCFHERFNSLSNILLDSGLFFFEREIARGRAKLTHVRMPQVWPQCLDVTVKLKGFFPVLTVVNMFSIHSSFLTETAAILEIHIIVFYHCYLII